MKMERLPNGGASVESAHPNSDTGLAFGLSDEQFEKWWFHRLLAEDASEYVHLYGGTRNGAKFVFALDYLSHIDRRRLGSDVITRAYCLAMGMDEREAAGVNVTNAEALYRDDAVQFLLNRIRSRSAEFAVDRIYGRTVAKINEIYDRTASIKNDDESAERAINGELVVDPEERRKNEQIALQASTELIKIAAKEKQADAVRRDKRALALALAQGAAKDQQDHALPSPDEAKQFIIMLRDAYGAEQFAEILEAAKPKALPE